MEPQPFATAVSPNFSFTCSSFADNKGTLAEGTQQRTLAIVRTSPTNGFYVDFFRSKSTVTNRVATTLERQRHQPVSRLHLPQHRRDQRQTSATNGVTLPLVSQPNRFQNDIGDANEQPGWRYFTNTVVSYPHQPAGAGAVRRHAVGHAALHGHASCPPWPTANTPRWTRPAIVDAPSPYDGRVAPHAGGPPDRRGLGQAFAAVYEPHFGSDRRHGDQRHRSCCAATLSWA